MLMKKYQSKTVFTDACQDRTPTVQKHVHCPQVKTSRGSNNNNVKTAKKKTPLPRKSYVNKPSPSLTVYTSRRKRETRDKSFVVLFKNRKRLQDMTVK